MSVIHFSVAELQAAASVCCGVAGYRTDCGQASILAALAAISVGNTAQWNRTYPDKVEPVTAEQIRGRQIEGCMIGSPRWLAGISCLTSLAYNTDGAHEALALVQQIGLYAAREGLRAQAEEMERLRAEVQTLRAPKARRVAK